MKIGTHDFEALDNRYLDYKMLGCSYYEEYKYYKCAHCGLIAFYTHARREYFTTSLKGLTDPGSISCNDWIVQEIIQ